MITASAAQVVATVLPRGTLLARYLDGIRRGVARHHGWRVMRAKRTRSNGADVLLEEELSTSLNKVVKTTKCLTGSTERLEPTRQSADSQCVRE
jgi:hypothetical protein